MYTAKAKGNSYSISSWGLDILKQQVG
jgi:hypothetical protein